MHDFHPPISDAGLYWVVPVPANALRFSPDGKSAVIEMKGIDVVDQPRWPALDATGIPARMSFRLEWKATDEPLRYENPAQHFLVQGFRATAQLEAQVEAPSIGFSWKSDPLSTSHADFAMIGDEMNGRYYDMKS